MRISAKDILIVIPARYNSSRFPGKPLVKINGIESIIKFGKEIAFVREKDLETIKKMITGGYEPKNENYFLKGNPVTVDHGPLKGIVGEVLEVENQNRLVMRIEGIQKSISIKINQGFLKLLD